jgi:pimeloyl-ACP methyl ester carboxylesterase
VAGATAIVWHGGTPHTGAPLPPLERLAAACGLALVTTTRPGYGGTPPRPGRSVADAARDVGVLLEEHDLRDVVAAGYSGGGPHALALAALAPGRVRAVVTVASGAPYDGTEGWSAGMAAPEDLRAAATGGRRARAARPDAFDPAQFVDADWAVLAAGGAWEAVGDDAEAAAATSREAIVDDDVALTAEWRFDLADVRAPVTLLHGDADRVVPPHHAEALLAQLPDATLDLRPGDGHVAVLEGLAGALDALA